MGDEPRDEGAAGQAFGSRHEGVAPISPEDLEALLDGLQRRLGAVYGERLCSLHLFGSYARADAGPESDVDVLVVLDEVGSYMTEVRRTGGVVSELSLAHDVTVTPVFVSAEHWASADTPFLRNVRAEGRPAA